MTREEAIDLVIKVFDTLEGECNIEYDWSKEHKARDMAIKALEQEPIFDKPHIKGDYYDGFKNGLRTAEWRNNKIRAEIEQLRLHKAQFLTNDNKVCIDSQEVLNIIDKYKAESEVEK